MHNLVFVQYVFDKNEHEINVAKHGSFKNDAPYYRTSEKTKEKMKAQCSNKSSPTAVFHESIHDKVGVTHLENAAGHARHVRQVKYIKKAVSEKPGDQIMELIEMVKEGERDKRKAFVRKVESSSDPCVVLRTDHQLNDVARSCTNPTKFSVLRVDPTFNFGKYYATVTTYRHLLLRNKNGVHPVRIGPVLVHNKKEAASYHELSATMIKLNPEIRHTLAFGTDGEKALSDGLGWSFPGAQHLLCDLHFRDNISSKLKGHKWRSCKDNHS